MCTVWDGLLALHEETGGSRAARCLSAEASGCVQSRQPQRAIIFASSDPLYLAGCVQSVLSVKAHRPSCRSGV